MPYLLESDFATELEAIINDTTGTLIASQYVRPQTKIGVILGTGCNAAYMEDVSCIGKLKDAGIDPSEQMAINCEWVRYKFAALRQSFILNRVPLTLTCTNTFQKQNMTLLWIKLPINLVNRPSRR